MEMMNSLKSIPSKQQAAAKYLIGFFALMVLLTFLSRAADSFNVPVVTTETVTSGSLVHKVTADGSLYPVSQIGLSVPSGYRILFLHVEQGSQVMEGDKLATLDISQIKEQLDDAQSELKKLQLLAAASATEAPIEEDESAIDVAQRALDRAKADLEVAEREGDVHISSASGDVAAARRYLRELRDEGESTDQELDDARNALIKVEQALELEYLEQEKALEAAYRAVEDAEFQLEQAQENLIKSGKKDAADQTRKSLEWEAANVDIQQQQKKINELTDFLETDGIVTASAAGVITKVTGSVGSVTTGESLFVLSDTAAGVRFQTCVDRDALKYIVRGNTARIVLTGVSRTVDGAIIESVSTVAEEDGTFRIMASLPKGNWEPGTGGKITISQKTASYSLCVTNGAIRSDNSGNYVLVLRETNGVLGALTVAERVNISILERDDNRCAIEGPLDKNDHIIVSSTRAIAPDDRVRSQEVSE